MSRKIVLVRTDSGKLHVAWHYRRVYVPACGTEFAPDADLWCYTDWRDQDKAWRLEMQCKRCAARLKGAKSFEDLARRSGW